MSHREEVPEKSGKETDVAVTRVDSVDTVEALQRPDHWQQSPTSNNEGSDGETRGRWTRSFFRFGPLSGIFSMLLAFASIIASLGVLAGSNGRSIEDWTTPPSTYIALFTALANLSVRYAAAQGVVVAWWMRAMKGSTLSKLQYDWRSGSTFLGALTAGRNTGLLGLACIFSTLVVIDGPLLQRASTVVRTDVSGQPLSLDVTIAPELPRAFSGYWTTPAGLGDPGGVASLAWNDTIPIPGGTASNHRVTTIWPAWLDVESNRLWTNDTPLANVIIGCPGECKAKVRAPALFPSVPCQTAHVPMTYTESYNLEATTDLKAPPLETYEFMINTNIVLDGKEKIAIITGHNDIQAQATRLKDCKATFVYQTCLLEAGIGEYDVHIEANEIIMTSLGTPKFVSFSNDTRVDYSIDEHTGFHPSTLGGVINNMAYRWESFVSSWQPPKGQAIAETYASMAVQVYQKEHSWCPSYRDPHDDVMDSINKLMFYMGALAGRYKTNNEHDSFDKGGILNRENPIRTTVVGYPEGKQDVFRTHYAFFIAAAMVELVCILLVAPTYWGWWRLGRSVSFSPLQIAKAFEAPLLSHSNSNSSDWKLAEGTKDSYVKYGVVSGREGDTMVKIAFRDPTSHDIKRPRYGQRFNV